VSGDLGLGAAVAGSSELRYVPWFFTNCVDDCTIELRVIVDGSCTMRQCKKRLSATVEGIQFKIAFLRPGPD